jgi:uncharacterized protein YjbI with pentapeptide repeats
MSSFRRAYLNGTKFNNSDLKGANFKKSIIKGSDFSDCLLNNSDFSGSQISDTKLSRANIRNGRFCSSRLDAVRMTKAHFEGSLFRETNFINCNLRKAKLIDSDIVSCEIENCWFNAGMLNATKLDGCKIVDCDFRRASFMGSKLSNNEITGSLFCSVDFRHAQLNSNAFIRSDLSRSRIFGVSAWRLSVVETAQEALRISDIDEAAITIDNIEVAQFIYLLIKNEKLRSIIDTITSKVVLIIGRFTDDRMAILNLLRDGLRSRNYLPILFDFTGPTSRDLTETITTLASLSKFVIADITEPRSIPQELSHIIPHMPSLPIQPIVLEGHLQYGMFEHFKRYAWVLETIRYRGFDDVKSTVLDEIISCCERKVLALRKV